MRQLIKIHRDDLINLAAIVYMNARLEAAERITSPVDRELLIKTDPLFENDALEKLKKILGDNIDSLERDTDETIIYPYKPEIIKR